MACALDQWLPGPFSLDAACYCWFVCFQVSLNLTKTGSTGLHVPMNRTHSLWGNLFLVCTVCRCVCSVNQADILQSWPSLRVIFKMIRSALPSSMAGLFSGERNVGGGFAAPTAVLCVPGGEGLVWLCFRI